MCRCHQFQVHLHQQLTYPTASHHEPWEVEQEAEINKCSNFTAKTCGCKMADEKPCSSLFGLEYYIDIRSQASLMTRQQLDLAVLEIAVGHWPFSDQFQHLTNQNPF